MHSEAWSPDQADEALVPFPVVFRAGILTNAFEPEFLRLYSKAHEIQ
jgi:hypothetical protein